MKINRCCNLNIIQVLDMYNYRKDYMKECIIQNIIEDLEDGINTDKFELKDDGCVYCNSAPALLLAEWVNTNYDVYRKPINHLNDNKRKTEHKRELDTEIYLKHGDSDLTDDEINKYISDKCIGIPLNGKTIDEIDISVASDRDIKTINGCIDKYNSMAKAGHNTQAYRMYSVYQYVEDNDPDICKRSKYLYDYDYIELDDYSMRYTNTDFKELRKALKINRKKANKRLKNKKNQKFINSLYDTQY